MLGALFTCAALVSIDTAAHATERRAAPVPKPHVGIASTYGPGFAGKPTASGEPMRPNALTAASKKLPLGTKAKITNLENGKSVEVRINDRGPYVPGRVIDLSTRAAKTLDIDHKEDGLAKVKVQPIEVPAQDRREEIARSNPADDR